MLTQNEITSLSLSPTKKDFVQIWNELLEVAGKLSERWDPTSTNESDPGIVILKALVGIADKLNYNIDKNTLEAFMPTAAQEDSMRKLCEMLGYNVKYYQSATANVSIKYHNTDPDDKEKAALDNADNPLAIPKFSVITNADQDINYFTINEYPVYISSMTPTIEVLCMEGQLVQCESINDNNVITASQISENNRFYLPETQIAENGIFIYNVFNSAAISGNNALEDGIKWLPVSNLNVQEHGSRVYKFGFDSYEGRPYIEFPEDYGELFGDGIFVYYTRTSGAAGNISSRTLTKLEFPSSGNYGNWSDVASESISVENTFAATTGANIETIKQAYNNFKKTIGTFETLVTCRDYMNKIYSMQNDLGKPLVSNILVSDIRTDLNRAVTICSCDRAGIFYKESSRFSDTPVSDITKPFFDGETWRLNNKNGPELTNFVADPSFKADATGEISYKQGYWTITQDNIEFITNLSVGPTTNAIDHFDLILYPFKSYNQIKNNVRDIRTVYDASFQYSEKTFEEIKRKLAAEDIKTIAHNELKPRHGDTKNLGDIISINNYLRLNATIATTSKITIEEGAIIIDKLKIALANAFNMRELDFGEEIPFDSIVEVMENADSRIKLISLNEPALYTTFSVFTGYDSLGNPEVKEYAVASDWLTIEQAIDANRFDMDKVTTITGTNGEKQKISLSTFNTKEARLLYNKLAVRNVLAGRVPLFDYNETFKTSFSEGAYQITRERNAADVPADLPLPDKDNPFIIYTSSADDSVFTGQFIGPGANDIKYTETYTPTYTPESEESDESDLKGNIKNNVITNNVITTINENAITDITTDCRIFATDGKIADVKLAKGEFIKFRAPNFTTVKTYPAYVNYHLDLKREVLSNAVNAEAYSLFSLLNSNKDDWTLESPDNNWQKALNYFTDLDASEGRSEAVQYKKIIKQQQTISAYSAAASTSEDSCSSPESTTGHHENDGTGKCKYCGTRIVSAIQKGPVIIDINDETISDEEKDLTTLLNKSGCLKISEEGHEITYDKTENKFIVKTILEWKPAADDSKPSGVGPNLDISIKISSLFITSSTVLADIHDSVQMRLEEMVGQVREDGKTPVLPTEGDWTITFKYEGVPFEPRTLDKWKNFIVNTSGLMDFTPFTENDTVFWRTYGEGYTDGKYILQSSEKLLEFDRNYFGLLPESRLRGIYLIKDVGKDAQAAIIKNDTEYKLRDEEYLYIEYTPSTTTDDGTTKESDPVTEILGPGTIIKPSGFEGAGLKDSSVYASEGTSFHKTVTFETSSGTRKQIPLHKFGANEQVEVRDLARVELGKKSFKAAPIVYYYKNFNGCEALEEKNYTGERKYTLKDGEYIFYTDQNKAELAYFTTGTEVSLEGGLILGQFDVIELATIFDTGISEIPWSRLNFTSDNDKIIFQEYQYRTLGPEDTLKKLTLISDDINGTEYLSGNWQYCDEVTYLPAGAAESDHPDELPSINTYDDRVESSKGCGWEACAVLDLDVSNNSEQVLRKTSQIQTSIKLSSTSPSGADNSDAVVSIIPEDEDHPLAFKTNLSCQTSSNHINIKDIYSNPKKLPGFEFKIFTKEEPAIVETLPGRVSPYNKTVTDITKWEGEPINIQSSSSLWKEIDLDDIKVNALNAEKNPDHDNALRLPVSILPNTYGVFSIYVEPTSTTVPSSVWIEVLPGTSQKDITIFNVPETDVIWQEAPIGITNGSPRLMLKPGINCIRVNKTGRLFIKASADAQGSLFFDDLKLVNSTPIGYNQSNLNNKEFPTSTYGLNIKQLGYLNPNDVSELADTLAVDEDIRKTLINSCVEDTFTKLSKIDKQYNKTYTTNLETLLEIQPKLAKILDLVDSAKNEINDLLERASSDYTFKGYLRDLFRKYLHFSEELTTKQELLKALEENKNVELLDGEIANLLAGFTTVEETQQSLQDELNQLKTTSLSELATVSKDEYLADYMVNMKTRYKELLGRSSSEKELKPLAAAIESTSRDLIEQDYNAKLIPLLGKIEKVVNSEERVRLLSVLSGLKENSIAETRTKLLLDVKRAVETADFTELEGLLDSILNAAINVDYKTLDALVVRLQAQLSDNNFATLMTELEVAATENKDSQLIEIVSALKNILAGKNADGTGRAEDYYGGSVFGDNTDIPEEIPDLIATILYKIKNNHSAEVESPSVTECARRLHKAVTDQHKAKLTAMLDAIETSLHTITATNNAYAEANKQLQDSSNEQVNLILDELETISNSRIAYINKLGNATDSFRRLLTKDYDSSTDPDFVMFKEALPFYEDAIFTAWKDFRTSELLDKINEVVKEISNKISNLTDIDITIKVDTIKNLPALLKDSKNKFMSFVTKVTESASQAVQNGSFEALVEGIPNIDSSDLRSAMSATEDYLSTNPTDHAVILAKISDYKKASTLLDKQEIAKSLEKTIRDNIVALEPVVKALAELLVPTLINLETRLPEAFGDEHDTFYDDWVLWLIEIRETKILISDNADGLGAYTNLSAAAERLTTGELVPVASLLEALNENTLRDWLKNTERAILSNLFNISEKYEELLKEMQSINKVQSLIAEANLVDFTTLTSEEIANWLKNKGFIESENDADFVRVFDNLAADVDTLSNMVTVNEESKKAYDYLVIERQLLKDLNSLDTGRDFYYTAPTNLSLAIEFNESDPNLNTLMNPAMNYDVNNINNNFVISKLDIDYLDRGIQISRSSRLN